MAIPPSPPPPLTELVIFVHISYLSTHTVYRYNMQFFHYGVHVSYLSTHTVYQYNMHFFHYGGGHHNEKNACYTGKLYGWYLSMFHTCQPIQFTGITCIFFVMVPVIPVNCMSWQVGNMDKYHQLHSLQHAYHWDPPPQLMCKQWKTRRRCWTAQLHLQRCIERNIHENYRYPRTKASVWEL